MLNTVILMLSIFLYGIPCIFSQSEQPKTVKSDGKKHSFYTDNVIGTKLKPYFPSKVQLLSFVDDFSCFTCHVSLSSIIKKYNHKIGFVIIYNTRDSSKITELKTKYFQDVETVIIQDAVGAYFDYYHVKRSSISFLIDKDSVLRSMYVPGSASSSFEKLSAMIDNLLNDKHSSNDKSQGKITNTLLSVANTTPTKIGEYPIKKHDGKEYPVILERRIYYLPLSKYIAFVDDDFFTIYDTNLRVIAHKKLSNVLAGFNPSYLMFCGEKKCKDGNDIDILFVDADQSSVDAMVVGYNIKEDSVYHVLRLPAKHYKNEYIDWIGMKYLPTCNSFVNYTRPTDYIQLQQNHQKGGERYKLLTLYNEDAEPKFKKFGSIDRLYDSLFLDNYYWVQSTSDKKGNIYSIMGMSQQLNIYNCNGDSIKSIKCNFSSRMWDDDWLKYATTLNGSSDMEDIKALSEKIPRNIAYQMMIDDATEKVYILQARPIVGTHGIEGARYAIHQVDTRTEEQRTFFFDDNVLPFMVLNDVIWCTESKGETTVLTKYSYAKK